MTGTIRSGALLALAVCLAGATGSAQSAAQATYKSKCQNCHGATGMADTTMGKAMKVKPVTDPDVKKLSAATMLESTKNGEGKMQAYKGKLTDEEIKDLVTYFRTFMK